MDTTTFTVIGENMITGNSWPVVEGLATRGEADEIRRGFTRLEADYRIAYCVVSG